MKTQKEIESNTETELHLTRIFSNTKYEFEKK
jgi:hypothetical protein